ncbi:MAG: transposase [Chroococcidiopsidaceae cyanobacterium CP_BM_ER_R8_30]|nr:transposase [Chroococcidiopsidaceae cyanobacterium CP_BM_ER_R8_30]
MKAQLLVEFETGQIIFTAVDKGKTHDLKLLKRSRLPFVPSQLCLVDRGYQGFAKCHAGACTPTKKPRNQPLPKAEKQHNRALAQLRIRVEHVIRRFKIFRIFSLALSQSKKTVWLALKSDGWVAQLRTGTCFMIHAGDIMSDCSQPGMKVVRSH